MKKRNLYKLTQKGLTPIRIYKTEYLYYIDVWKDGVWENDSRFNWYESDEFESRCECFKYNPDFIDVDCFESWMDKFDLNSI